MSQFIPAFSIMAFVVAILLIFVLKFKEELLASAIKSTNQVVVLAVFTLCILIIMHLFSPQTWTPDLLKVLAGVLVGAASAGSVSSLIDAAKTVEAAGATFGDNAKLAAGDINEISNKIDNMKGDISSIRDSVIQQVGNSEDRDKDKVYEFLFTTHYYKEAEPLEIIAKESKDFENDGWFFSSVIPNYGYSGDDGGVMAVYSRSREPGENDVKLLGGGYATRFYHGDDRVEIG